MQGRTTTQRDSVLAQVRGTTAAVAAGAVLGTAVVAGYVAVTRSSANAAEAAGSGSGTAQTAPQQGGSQDDPQQGGGFGSGQDQSGQSGQDQSGQSGQDQGQIQGGQIQGGQIQGGFGGGAPTTSGGS